MNIRIVLTALMVIALGGPLRALYAAGSKGTSLLGLVAANEYSKEYSLYQAKSYVMREVLGGTEAPVVFQVYALAAATSGELTSLVYSCTSPQKEGLLLAFYGNRVSEAGVSYQAFGFKNLPKAKAIALLEKIENVLKISPVLVQGDLVDNNIYFQYDDMTLLVNWPALTEPHIRVFWGQYDSDWNISSFRKTVRRMAKKI